ncbi:hypothetical protein [Stenotrophomonas sp. PS02300]|uniref:YobI family P-loop NTPase n=1 Tax=Stenotrophomonas sp. PS02300 TaxID=2991426 RepID=UPI00249C6800|nr:hypothetical protein [Stenotrophomonas sp. PS02300]
MHAFGADTHTIGNGGTAGNAHDVSALRDGPDESAAVSGYESARLLPLIPTYVEKDHGPYVRQIDLALDTPGVNNVALSGNYGVGKSSVLRKVAEKHQERVVQISLSALAPAQMGDESLPPQATTTTNRIQQEIVKQLLYREAPEKMRGSRFRRIERFLPLRETIAASIVGVCLSVVFLLAGWTHKLSLAFHLVSIGVWVHLLMALFAALLVFSVRWHLHGRVNVRQLSAGAATVTLDEKSASFFDQYLDEIVYFFEVSKRDVVIFEDIDRFDDHHIFEALRALNTLLNAPTTRRSVRFIYAVRDSMFDYRRLGGAPTHPGSDEAGLALPEVAEVSRSNRTKFFDLVIPVVPFITHQNAKGLVKSIMDDVDHEIDDELIDLASRHVPEMRLLKNVRNEFIVFRERILSGDGARLNVTDTRLFAMMLYKATHLIDFEKIRLGTSSLDLLYTDFRKMVDSNIRHLDHQGIAAKRKAERQAAIAARSAELGRRLVEYVDMVARICGRGGNPHRYMYAENPVSEDALGGPKFWRTLLSSEEASPLEIRFSDHGYNMVRSLYFSRADLELVLGTLDPNEWQRSEGDLYSAEQRQRAVDVDFLRGAGFSELLGRKDFTVRKDGVDLTFDDIAKTHLKDGLAYRLVRAGHIRADFTLYTAVFQSRSVGPAAMNFIVHHIDRNVMDMHFELSSGDVESLIKERPNALADATFYNVSILNNLLSSSPVKARVIARSLAVLQEDQRSFLNIFLSVSDKRSDLVRLLAPEAKGILEFLAGMDMDDGTRARLIGDALSNLDAKIEYSAGESLASFISGNILAIDRGIVQSGGSWTPQAGDLFQRLSLSVGDLTQLSEELQEILVARNLYSVTRKNLMAASKGGGAMALDVMRRSSQAVYWYAIDNLVDYLGALDDGEFSVVSNSAFVTVLRDLAIVDFHQVGAVLKRAAPACRLVTFDSVPSQIWGVVARSRRVNITKANIARYVEMYGGVDQDLAASLADAKSIPGTIEDQGKAEATAQAILAAGDYLSSRNRAILVSQLPVSLVPDAVPPESGELIPRLMSLGALKDDADTFSRLSGTDWKTRELYITMSKRFGAYLSPELIGGDLANFMGSSRVKRSLKVAVVERSLDYAAPNRPRGMIAMARFAIENSISLPIAFLQRLAKVKDAVEVIFGLLPDHLPEVEDEALLEMISSLGEPFSDLCTVDAKKPKVPALTGVESILAHLKDIGCISSFKREEDYFRVNKKRSLT